jgi:hypothetical protein
MKTVLFGMAALFSVSAMAAPQMKVVCAAAGSVDSISQLEVVPADSNSQLVATITTQKSETKTFVSQGTLADQRIQLSTLDKGPFGTDRVYLEKTTKGYAIVKINQCSFSYQEETCSAEEQYQFSEVSRDEVVACVLVQK